MSAVLLRNLGNHSCDVRVKSQIPVVCSKRHLHSTALSQKMSIQHRSFQNTFLLFRVISILVSVLVGYTKVPGQPKRNVEEDLNMKGKKRRNSNKTPK